MRSIVLISLFHRIQISFPLLKTKKGWENVQVDEKNWETTTLRLKKSPLHFILSQCGVLPLPTLSHSLLNVFPRFSPPFLRFLFYYSPHHVHLQFNSNFDLQTIVLLDLTLFFVYFSFSLSDPLTNIHYSLTFIREFYLYVSWP